MSDDRRGGRGHGGNHGGDHGGGNHGNGNHHGGGNEEHHEPPPSRLDEKVDWMSFSHQALYDMVHTGVDLKAAGSAQADWAMVGKALDEVQGLLAKAITQSQQAWSGESAERAREALVSVEKWALNTSGHADNVAKCIGEEIQHVETARQMMPAPSPAPPTVDPVTGGGTPPVAGQPDTRAALVQQQPAFRVPGNHGVQQQLMAEDAGGAASRPLGFRATSPVAPNSPFTGLENVAAPVVDSVVAADATHRQAAEVMALFQQNSYAVDRTVPSFSPPTNPVAPPTPPPVVVTPHPVAPPPVPDGGPVVVNPNQNQPARPERGATTPSQGRGGGSFARGGFAGGRGPVPVPLGSAGGGGAGGPAPLGPPGLGSGAVVNERSAGGSPGGVTSQFQAPKSVTPQHGMIGAAPMAAPPPVGSAPGGSERNRPGYLEDDDNVFGVDRKAAPPVIGL
ncbi:hypothetical protein AB0I60_11625 [Actinosynnema sp. NPDC050436]|uniref:hypothetical protein n=1 Tax=Actinosynnema sp. NPDC050436 TaxID=3155659 RepID=UPI0033DD1B7F